jgi:hypothetical protein
MSKDDRSREVFAVAALFFVLTWTTVCLRVYVRAILMKTWGKDDSFMVASLVSCHISDTCGWLCLSNFVGGLHSVPPMSDHCRDTWHWKASMGFERS